MNKKLVSLACTLSSISVAVAILLYPGPSTADNILDKLRQKLEEAAERSESSAAGQNSTEDRELSDGPVAEDAGSEQSTAKYDDSDSRELSEWEIAGLRLGMSANDVNSVLRARYPDLVGNKLPRVRPLGEFRYQLKVTPISPSTNSADQQKQSFAILFAVNEDYDERERNLQKNLRGETRKKQEEKYYEFQNASIFVVEIGFDHVGPKFSFNPKEFVRSRFGEIGEMDSNAERKIFGSPSFRGYPTEMTVRFSYQADAHKADFPDSMIGAYTLKYTWGGIEAHGARIEEIRKAYIEKLMEEQFEQIESTDEPF